MDHPMPSTDHLALSATVHCLTGCGIGEVLGLVITTQGAMAASIGDPLFWGSLALSLAIAGVAVYPVNRWLIGRGRGHAAIHGHHRPGWPSGTESAPVRGADSYRSRG